MRDAAREPPDRVELLRLPELCLERPHLGDVEPDALVVIVGAAGLVAHPRHAPVLAHDPVLDPDVGALPLRAAPSSASTRSRSSGCSRPPQRPGSCRHSATVYPVTASICGLTNSIAPRASGRRGVGHHRELLDQRAVAPLGQAQRRRPLLHPGLERGRQGPERADRVGVAAQRELGGRERLGEEPPRRRGRREPDPRPGRSAASARACSSESATRPKPSASARRPSAYPAVRLRSSRSDNQVRSAAAHASGSGVGPLMRPPGSAPPARARRRGRGRSA